MVNPTSKQAFASMPPSPAFKGKREGNCVVGKSWVGEPGGGARAHRRRGRRAHNNKRKVSWFVDGGCNGCGLARGPTLNVPTVSPTGQTGCCPYLAAGGNGGAAAACTAMVVRRTHASAVTAMAGCWQVGTAPRGSEKNALLRGCATKSTRIHEGPPGKKHGAHQLPPKMRHT